MNLRPLALALALTSAAGCTEARDGRLVEVGPGSDVYAVSGQVTVLEAQLSGSLGSVDVTGQANVQLDSTDPSWFHVSLTTPDGIALVSLSASGLEGGFGPPPSTLLDMVCTGSAPYSFENELTGSVLETSFEDTPGAAEDGPALKTLTTQASVLPLDGGEPSSVQITLELAIGS